MRVGNHREFQLFVKNVLVEIEKNKARVQEEVSAPIILGQVGMAARNAVVDWRVPSREKRF